LRLNTFPNLKSVALNLLTNQQQSLVKGHLVDIANRSNKCFLDFAPLDLEFSPGFRVIDYFSDCISFNFCNKDKDDTSCTHQLNKIVLKSSSSPSVAIIASDASIKNNVATSITYIHTYKKPLTKTVYHVVLITSTKAELFAIRCGINQAMNLNNIAKIIVVTNSIHVARKIFDSSVYPYQIQSAAILYKLHNFFNCYEDNIIEFWECPSQLKWCLHNRVDKKTKSFNLTPLYPCKSSWEFSKKSKSDEILNTWKMTFQASDSKENQFLDLLDDDDNIIEPSYVKGRLWLKVFGHSNSLCACATRAIMNHAPTGKYRLRFFPREDFKYLCGLYSIESRRHILYECGRFNGYWNPRRDSLSHFVMFLEFNPSAFTFSDSLA